MQTLTSYAKNRYTQKSLGFGRTWVRWLWLDAALYAVARWTTLHSPLFWLWCRKVDRLFVEQYDFGFSLTENTGRDCWIDAYWNGDTPQDAVNEEVSYWEE